MDRPALERVTLDSNVLLGPRSKELFAAASLGYFHGNTSVWITSEFSRVRTEWIAVRAVRDGVDGAETKARLERSRAKINALVAQLSTLFRVVDYHAAENADLFWLRDPDDHPVMQTAIAAGIPGILVTDNSREFPIGENRNGITLLSTEQFLATLYSLHPNARDSIAVFLASLAVR